MVLFSASRDRADRAGQGDGRGGAPRFAAVGAAGPGGASVRLPVRPLCFTGAPGRDSVPRGAD